MMISNILCRGMFPQYAVTGRELSGEIGEAIIEDFILNGHSCMSEVSGREEYRYKINYKESPLWVRLVGLHY